MKKTIFAVIVAAVCGLFTAVNTACAQGTAFTYQGRLNTNNTPVNGTFDFTFALWTLESGGSQEGSTLTVLAVPVTNGIFTVTNDFGAVFNGTIYWLQIGVRTNGGSTFSPLSPRQELTPTPYAIYAEGANAAGLTGAISLGVNGGGLTNVNAATLGGLGPNNFWQTTGNAGTLAGVNFAGTTDNQPFYMDVSGAPVLKLGTNHSIAMGNCSLGSGFNINYEVALGQGAQATGNGSVAIGWNPNSSGPGSVAIGESVTSSGNDSFASGGYSQATASDATAMGYFSVASGTYSMALGYQAQALHTSAFVWADDSAGVYASTGPNQFLIRATGGVGIGTTSSPQQFLSVHGGLNVDQANYNDGVINNGATNSYALTFGNDSGEGIASQRQPGAGNNQYGLDFYTDFTHRMTITQGGLVGIGVGTNAPVAALEVANGNIRTDGNALLCAASTGSFASDGLYNGSFGLSGINDNYGPGLWGYFGGSLGGLSPNIMALSWDASGDVSVNNNLSAGSLTVRGEYLVVNGLTPVYCYIGDDGSGNDVQIGSQKSGITAVSCYNSTDNAYMHLYVSSITIEGGADLAEPFQISSPEKDIPQGSVVVIDEKNPGRLRMSDRPYDTRVAGVVSGANGINPGIELKQQGLLDGGKNVALTGRVYVQADASNGAIQPGDLLTTSTNPGHAMKVTNHSKAQGAILGKAMSGLDKGEGMILVLVTLQ